MYYFVLFSYFYLGLRNSNNTIFIRHKLGCKVTINFILYKRSNLFYIAFIITPFKKYPRQE